MIVALLWVVVVDWAQLDITQQLVFGGLSALALSRGWRGIQALRILPHQPGGWQSRYTDHVGFILISLFAGFVVIAAIDLRAPGWLVGVITLVGIAGGIWAVNIVKSRILSKAS